MEDREDGELSESNSSACDDEIYNPIMRPTSNICHPRNVSASIPSDSENSSSDSDSDFASRPKRPKTLCTQMEIEKNGIEDSALNGTRKKNNIWANVLQEEELTLEIGGVGLKKLKGDRNVESYDYTQAAKLYNNESKDCFSLEFEEVETEEDIQKRLMRKRRFYDTFSDQKKKDKKLSKPRLLHDIELDPEWSDKELADAIADALFEQKPELIVKVVEVLGREKALELYTRTQKVEKEGGMMIFSGSRRRTSGGVYLQLLKTLDGVNGAHLAQIFNEDNKDMQQWRKRKRVNRKRDRQKSGDAIEEDGLHLKGLFTDDPGGTKCPGSTPVTSPTASDEDIKGSHGVFIPLKEVCERAASQIGLREEDSSPTTPPRQEEMETC